MTIERFRNDDDTFGVHQDGMYRLLLWYKPVQYLDTHPKSLLVLSFDFVQMRRLASSRRFMSTRTAAMAMAMDNGAILNQPRMAASAAGGRLDNVVYAK